MSNDLPEKPNLPKPPPFREQMEAMRDYYETHHFTNDTPEKGTLDSLEDGSVFFCGRHLAPPLDPETQEALENLRLIPSAPDEAAEEGSKK